MKVVSCKNFNRYFSPEFKRSNTISTILSFFLGKRLSNISSHTTSTNYMVVIFMLIVSLTTDSKPYPQVKKSYKTMAIIGFISKGVIYLVIGTLSLLAALRMGGESSGTNQALAFLKRQVFGQIMLLFLGTGLLCYSFWMFVQSIQDPENLGSNRKAKSRRFGLFTTGMVYTAVGILAFYHLFTRSYTGDSETRYLSFVNPSVLSFFFICIGIVLLAQAIVLIVGAFKGGLLDQFNLEGQKHYRIIRSVGKFGFYARAFVVLIIAYFFLRAGIYTGNHDIKGMQDAFAFLDQSTVGRILMAVTAVGFISYGAFYVFLTRFRSFRGEE